ncbi:MAG: GNAT family N-acetyltransferase [Chloroflexi bacterium]|nr:GNAT family N-acetyltransferase [Chloroflexota bacterium]
MAISLYPADEVDFKAFIHAFNAAYHDYYVPIVLNQTSLRALIRRDSIDLSASVAAVDGDRVVGTSLLAIRGLQGWIGGVGVVPAYRRQGIARQMMQYLLDIGRQRQLAKIRLEVVERNAAAYALYQKLGFVVQRRLLMLERPPTRVTPNEDYSVSSCNTFEALQYYDVFHVQPNPWQRSSQALHDLAANLTGWLVAHKTMSEMVVAYAIGWYTDDRAHFLDVASNPDFSQQAEAIAALFASIHHDLPGATGHIVNLAEDNIAQVPLQALGYRETLAQYEMLYSLTHQ